MNFQLKCLHAECSDAMKAEILAKMQRIEPLVPEITFVEMELKQYPKVMSRGDKEAQIILDIPGMNSIIRYVCVGETFLEVVDRVLDKLDGQLTKLKDKETDYSYRGEPPKVRAAEVVNRDEIDDSA